jgi:sialate O-acetylesterase
MKYLLPVLAWLLLLPLTSRAQLQLAYLFADDMVLQQQANPAIWGKAKPGTTIKVYTSWNKQTYSTRADAQGNWRLNVATTTAGGPYEIKVSGDGQRTLRNVLLGEVWLCSGQSNMEMPMKGFKGQPVTGSNEAILHAKNPLIRTFIVPRSVQREARDTIKSSTWKVASPESIAGFSATGYYFGRLLNNMLDNVPVGLILSAYGGSPVEAFMSDTALQAFKDIAVPAKTDTAKLHNRVPTVLYNGMIHPVVGYGIRGCIWYQGETNYDRPAQYEQLFPAMVSQWRREWGIGDFPFYYCQIAPYDYSTYSQADTHSFANSALLRDAQRRALQHIPNSGMAVLMDLGEEKSIHPMRKEEGGTRLALLALEKTYGLKGFGAESPLYDSLSVKGGVATVYFRNAGNGLTSFGKPITGFEIAGKDKRFYPAKSVLLRNNTVLVSSAEVAEPVAVRYAFKDFTVGELYNTEGLPASSFRTDSW